MGCRIFGHSCKTQKSAQSRGAGCQELDLTPNIILAYGGVGDIAYSHHGPGAPLTCCVQQQVRSLHVRGLDRLRGRIQQDSRQKPGHLLVCLETALPCEPRPTIGFVVGTWFAKHVSEHELPQALEDRRQGSLSEVLALLAVLDFLTSADGHGYTATRVLTVKAAQHKCLARAELRLIFGPAEADPVRATAVMRLLQQGSDGEELLRTLKQMLPALASEEDFQQLREPCQLLLAASRCLSEEDPEETAKLALETLRLKPNAVSADELRALGIALGLGDTKPLDYFGVELYRSGVQRILKCFSAWTGDSAFEKMQPDIKAILTVLETSAAPCYDSGAPFWESKFGWSACPHASCIQELRRHIGQSFLERRFSRLRGRSLDAGSPRDTAKEQTWNRLFDEVDTDKNGVISMDEWWKALEDDCNRELRVLFQFENIKMKKLLRKLFKSSVHEEAESSVSRDEFVLACRMAERDELLWHFVHMVAGHDMESADCRSGSMTENDEHRIFKNYSGHLGIWQRLAESPLEAWREHCESLCKPLEEIRKDISKAKLVQDFVYLGSGCDEIDKVLTGSFSEQLFVKVAFNTSKSRQDVSIFCQLILLQCHVLEAIWESLFPTSCNEASLEIVEQCPELWLGIDYIFSDDGRCAFFSKQGFEKWRKSDKCREVWDREKKAHEQVRRESSTTGSRVEAPESAVLEAEHFHDHQVELDHQLDCTSRSGSHRTDSQAGSVVEQPENGFADRLSENLEPASSAASSRNEKLQVHQPFTPTYMPDQQVCRTVYPGMYPINLFPPAAEQAHICTDTMQAPPLDANSYLQTEAALYLYCEVLDKSGLLATTPEGPCQDFQDMLSAFTGYDAKDIHVQAMGFIRDEVEAVMLKAEIRPAETTIQKLRAVQQRLLSIKTACSSREFFDKFPANGGIQVSTTCCDNLGGPASMSLAGCCSCSYLTAHMDIQEFAADTGIGCMYSDCVHEVLAHLSDLGLIDQVQVLQGISGTRRLHFRLRPREAPTLEDLRTLQADLVEFVEARSGSSPLPALPNLRGSPLVIDSAVYHLPSRPTARGKSTLRCHLDITDESGWLHQQGGHRCTSEFLCILKKIASHFHLTSLEFPCVQMWQLKSKEYTMDFQVLTPCSTESRTIQQLLWALHQRSLHEWAAVDVNDAVFRGVAVKRPARVCAHNATAVIGERHSWQLRSSEDHDGSMDFMIWAELEVVDRFGAIKRNGGTHLATLLADCLHVVIGIEPARLSILNVAPIPRSELRQQPGAAGMQAAALVYSVKLEIDFSSCVAVEEDLQSIVEGTSSLHSSTVLHRWGHLPFFKQYFINGFVAREIQTCDHNSGKMERKPVHYARKAQPKVAAHLDLCCKVGSFHCSRGHGWPMHLAEMLSEALHQACSIAKDDIVITCVQLRTSCQQRSGLVSGFLEAMEKLELEAKVASDSDDETMDACRRGLSEILCEPPLASYTVEMEVILHDALDTSQELKRVSTSLRKFHSQAVRRKFAMLPFFREFDFDVGIQLFRSSSCHLGSSNKPLEEHMRPCRRIRVSPLIPQYSPVVLAGPCVQSQVDSLEDFIVFDGYTNIIQRGRAPPEYGPPVPEPQIRAWFLEALNFHLKEENLEVSSVPDTNGTSLAIRPPDREPLQFDGLWFRVTGVRARSAQTEKLQQRALKPSEAGAEAAGVTSGFLAYAIDFEIRRLGPGLGDDSGRYVALAEQVRAVLHGCLLHLHRMPTLKKKLKFYRHFEFDHGIQLDVIRHQESKSIGVCSQTHCAPCEAGLSTDSTKFSSTPRTFTVGVRFHTAGCTSPPTKPTASAVKISMAALLGLEQCQMEIASVEMKATWCEAELQIRTLTHAPAVAETEALGAKLASLHQNGVCSSSCQQLGSWKPVAVVAPALDEDAQPELAVAIQLQLLPPSNSVWPLGEREQLQLKAELQRKTGFSRQLHMTSLRQSSSCAIVDFAIIGLRKERAALLKAFWAAVDQSTPMNEHWSGRVVEVKMVEAAQLRSACPTGSLRSFAISETSAISATLGLREAIKDYIHLCRSGDAGSQERQVGLLKHILEILNKIEAPAGIASPCPAQQKHHLAKHGVAASLLQSFSSVLLEVVERHGTLANQEEHAIKRYFLSQDWRPEEMRYALRALTWVLAYDTKADTDCAHVRPGSRSNLQAALLDRAAGLAEVIRIYQRFLASLHEEDLLCGIYRPCSVLQNLLLALQGIQSKPCSATLHAWLAGTDFLEHLGRVLEGGRYRMAYGHAVALVFQVATQMTCKAYIARMDLEPKHSAIICENVNKLMKVMQMWSKINRPSPSGTWSKSLQEAIDTSVPEFVDFLEQLLPAAHAPSPVDKLKEWTRTELDNINVILGLRSSPPPRPMPSFCKCEV
eukprot:s167_g9.t1